MPTAMTGRSALPPLRVACRSIHSRPSLRHHLVTRCMNAGAASRTPSPASSGTHAGRPARAKEPPTHGPIRSTTLRSAAPASTMKRRRSSAPSKSNLSGVGSCSDHGTRTATALHPARRSARSIGVHPAGVRTAGSSDAPTSARRRMPDLAPSRKKLLESYETEGMTLWAGEVRGGVGSYARVWTPLQMPRRRPGVRPRNPSRRTAHPLRSRMDAGPRRETPNSPTISLHGQNGGHPERTCRRSPQPTRSARYKLPLRRTE